MKDKWQLPCHADRLVVKATLSSNWNLMDTFPRNKRIGKQTNSFFFLKLYWIKAWLWVFCHVNSAFFGWIWLFQDLRLASLVLAAGWNRAAHWYGQAEWGKGFQVNSWCLSLPHIPKGLGKKKIKLNLSTVFVKDYLWVSTGPDIFEECL